MKKIVTPKGSLQWVRIETPRLNQFNGNQEFSASIIMSKEEATPLMTELKEMFLSEHPKKKPQSMGFKTLDDGNIEFRFKTNATNKNGDKKVINCVDAYKKPFTNKGNIGNGSIGKISGTAIVYANGANVGVSLYLNAIQVLKWDEYIADDGFDLEEDFDSYFDEDEKPKQDQPKTQTVEDDGFDF